VWSQLESAELQKTAMSVVQYSWSSTLDVGFISECVLPAWRPVLPWKVRIPSIPGNNIYDTFLYRDLAGYNSCQALSAIRPGSPQWYQTGVLSASILFLVTERTHRVPYQDSTVGGGWQPFFVSLETAGWGRKCETGCCHGEAARSVLAKVRDDVVARFHAVASKRRSRTQNSQFGLLGSVLRATTTAV
jgi:hypothetical protein